MYDSTFDLNAVVPPVFMNSLHIFDSMESYAAREDEHAYVYGRVTNPTVQILEEKVAALEEGCMALAFSSGMAAASAAILAVCRAGSRPRAGGVKKLEMFIDGFSNYLRDVGDHSLKMEGFSGEDTDTKASALIKAQIDAGFPVPYLMLRHTNPESCLS